MTDLKKEDLELKKIEIELLKLKIEKLKFLESLLLRTIFIVLIPIGAGIVTFIFWIYGKTNFLMKLLLVVALSAFSLLFVLVWILFHKIYKNEKLLNESFKEL